MPPSTRIAILVAAAGLLGSGGAFALPSYVAVPLGTLGGTASYPEAISESGAVVGLSYTPPIDPTTYSFIPGNAFWRAFVLVNGAMRDLGMPEGSTSSATGINASGQMSVFVNIDAGQDSYTRVLRVSGSETVDVAPPGRSQRVWGINDAGQVVGERDGHAFVFTDGATKDIHTLGESSRGAAINALGHATGTVTLPYEPLLGSVSRAFLYRDGAMAALGALDSVSSAGTAINDRDEVAGAAHFAYMTQCAYHAILYTNGEMLDLGTLGGCESYAFGINNAGHVVGTSEVHDGSSRAFLFDGTLILDLNSLVVSGIDGVTLTHAYDINDKGQIVAVACLGIAMCQAFRLDPLPESGAKTLAIEYRHAAFDHYFLTADPVEIDALDRGAFAGWQRTGESFEMWTSPVAGASPLCRFFSAAFGEKSSHFYTPATSECMWVSGNPNWAFEGVRLYTMRPAADGSCAAGTRPVYRVYNDGQGGAPAHRNTTSLAVRAQMIASGWTPEGTGADGVGMCVPN